MSDSNRLVRLGTAGRPVVPYLALGVGVLAVSFASILTRGSAAPPLAVAFWRLFLSGLILGAGLLIRPGSLRTVSRRDWLLSGASGICLAAHFYFWNTSLLMTTVAASTVLVDMHPFVVVVLGYFFFGERMAPLGQLGAALVVAGAAAIGVSDAAGATAGSHAVLGDIYAFLGAMTVGVYFLIGRSVRQRVNVLPYTVTVYMVASTLLMAAGVASSTQMVSFPLRTWSAFAALAVIPTIMGHTVFSWVLKYIRAGAVSLSIQFEPVGAGLLAWGVFGERPGLWTLAGAVLILGGIGLFVTNERDGG